MLTNVKYILLTALRDWLFIALFIGVIFATYISHILGSTALLEPEQMTLVFTAASSRPAVFRQRRMMNLGHRTSFRSAVRMNSGSNARACHRAWCEKRDGASSSLERRMDQSPMRSSAGTTLRPHFRKKCLLASSHVAFS